MANRFQKSAWRFAVALAVSWQLACAANARDIFVNNLSGQDSNSGLSAKQEGAAGGPLRSIGRALKAAKPGDRIILAKNDEPYRESLTLQAANHSGIDGSPFTIVGNGAILDGTRPVPEEAWEHVKDGVFRFRPKKMSHQLLYLDGTPAKQRQIVNRNKLPDLEPLEWCLFDRHIYFRVEDDMMPDAYELAHTFLQVGITLYEVRHVVIDNLVVQGFQLDGVNAHDNVFDGAFVQLIARGNARSGISIGGASRVGVHACLVGNNGKSQIRTEGFCRVEIFNCDIIDDGQTPTIQREGGRVLVDGKPPAKP